MATIKHTAIIDPASGEIRSVGLGQAFNPTEGLQEDGRYVVHISFPIENVPLWMKTHYYVIDGEYSTWRSRVAPPNDFAHWNFESETWDWNSGKFLEYIREDRNYRLTSTDWTQVADAPLTAEQLAEVASYRQALRDITTPIIANPEQYPTEESIPWPTPPTFIA